MQRLTSAAEDGSSDPETKPGLVRTRNVPISRRGLNAFGNSVPGPAPQHALAEDPGRFVGSPIARRARQVVAPDILAPFPDVAVHVVKAESIRWKRTNWRCFARRELGLVG